jgi:hypothetical protein
MREGASQSAAGDCPCPRSIGRSLVSVKVQYILMPNPPPMPSSRCQDETSPLPSTNCAGNVEYAPSSIICIQGRRDALTHLSQESRPRFVSRTGYRDPSSMAKASRPVSARGTPTWLTDRPATCRASPPPAAATTTGKPSVVLGALVTIVLMALGTRPWPLSALSRLGRHFSALCLHIMSASHLRTA